MSVLHEATEHLAGFGRHLLRGAHRKRDVDSALARIFDHFYLEKEIVLKNVPVLYISQPTIYNMQNKDYHFLQFLLRFNILEGFIIHFFNGRLRLPKKAIVPLVKHG